MLRLRTRAGFLSPVLTHQFHSPIALGVFCASFLVVLASLLVISAQSTILKLVLFFYSASPLSRWAITRGWKRHLVSWYKSRRAARVCVWIKNDDVCCQASVGVLLMFLSLDQDPCHATSAALRAEKRSGRKNGYICSRIQKHRCHTQRTPPERPSP